jgi:hypothetical protein
MACQILRKRGIPDPLVWSRHTPFPVSPDKLSETLDIAGHPPYPEWKTLYGGMWGLAGEYGPNAKVFGRVTSLPRPYASTDERSFRLVRPLLEQEFPRPSVYEHP